MERRVLITGAGGQLGRMLRHVAPGYPLACTFAGHAELDVTDPAAVEHAVGRGAFDAVVNCAAYTAVDRAEEETEAADRLNREAPALLAAACRRHDTLLVHISTDYVFDATVARPLDEAATTAPASVYGRTKRAGEEAVAACGGRWLILRTSWLYAPWGPNFVRSVWERGRRGERLRVVDDQTGSPTSAEGLAHAVLDILARGADRGREGLYHYADRGQTTRYGLAVEILRLAGARGTVEPCTTDAFPARAPRPRYSVLDTAKFERTFHRHPLRWEEALERSLLGMTNEWNGTC